MTPQKKIFLMIGIIIAVVIFAIFSFQKDKPETTTPNLPLEESVAIDQNTPEIAIENAEPAQQNPVVATPSPTPVPPVVVSPTPSVPTVRTFTLAEVATHNNPQNCYSAINGSVYDLTAWINKHPGGDRNILRICGIDGSSAFDNQHGGDQRAENILAGFSVGILK